MFKTRFFVFSILISLVCIQLMMWGIFLNRTLFPPQVPLYYFKPWGEERLASAELLWLIPTWAGGIFVFNTILAWYLYRQEKFLAQVLVFTSAVISGLGLIFLLRIFELVLP